MMLVKLKGKYITQSGAGSAKETEMAIFTREKAVGNTAMPKAVEPAGGAGEHSSPVARLLARVSKLSDTYAEYEMEQGVWRKLAL